MTEIIKTPSVNLSIDEFTYNVETNTISGTVTGDGIFDTLMETATKHLLAQFESNRIRQEDYAAAYIHIYEVTLQAALKAWLEKDLTAAQIRNAEAQTAKLEADIAKIKAETLKVEEETKLLPEQLELIQAQTAQVEVETAKVQEETKLLPVQLELIEAEITKLEADTTKVEEETKLLPAQLELIEAQVENETAKLDLVREQLNLLLAQIGTEKGKTALYTRQIESFDESFKEKILKMMLETWGVGFSVASDAFETVPTPMTHTSIDTVFNNYILPELDKYRYPRPDDVVGMS